MRHPGQANCRPSVAFRLTFFYLSLNVASPVRVDILQQIAFTLRDPLIAAANTTEVGDPLITIVVSLDLPGPGIATRESDGAANDAVRVKNHGQRIGHEVTLEGIPGDQRADLVAGERFLGRGLVADHPEEHGHGHRQAREPTPARRSRRRSVL